MKSLSIAVVLLSICVLYNTALETGVQDTEGTDVQVEETPQTAAVAKEMDPLEVLFRTRRHLSHPSLCRYCCKCCNRKGCGFCCRW